MNSTRMSSVAFGERESVLFIGTQFICAGCTAFCDRVSRLGEDGGGARSTFIAFLANFPARHAHVACGPAVSSGSAYTHVRRRRARSDARSLEREVTSTCRTSCRRTRQSIPAITHKMTHHQQGAAPQPLAGSNSLGHRIRSSQSSSHTSV